MKKYTPGPWRKIAGDIQAQSLDGEWDLTIATGVDDENLDLIAAAPDLLDACINAYHYIMSDGDPKLLNGWKKERFLKQLKSAINKTEGKHE